MFSEHYDLTLTPTLLTNIGSKLKAETLYWYGDCGQSQH